MGADGLAALWTFSLVIGLLVAIAAPFEFAARHSPRFAAFLDETVRRVLG